MGVRVFLIGTILVLSAAVGVEVVLSRQWQQDRLAAARGTTQEPAAVGTVDSSVSILSLPPELVPVAELRERPLFVSGRRPFVAQPEAPRSERSGDVFVLTSTILTPGAAYAIIRDMTLGSSVTVAEGGRVGAWTLTQVEADQVTLSAGAEKRVLRLRRPQGEAGAGDPPVGRGSEVEGRNADPQDETKSQDRDAGGPVTEGRSRQGRVPDPRVQAMDRSRAVNRD